MIYANGSHPILSTLKEKEFFYQIFIKHVKSGTMGTDIYGTKTTGWIRKKWENTF